LSELRVKHFQHRVNTNFMIIALMLTQFQRTNPLSIKGYLRDTDGVLGYKTQI